MILTVSHTTVYRYDTPMRSAVQSLRLFPSEFDGQKIIDWSVDVVGGVKGAAFRDGAGDRIEGWSLRGPADEVRVVVEGQVETTDLTGVLRGHRESVSPEVYLRATTATQPDAGLLALAASAWRRADGLDTAHRLAAKRWRTLSPTAPARPMNTRPRPRRWRRAKASARTMPMR